MNGIRILAGGARVLALLLGTVVLLGACGAPREEVFHGYAEGEFVYVSAPLAGRLTERPVVRGAQVEAGAPLFALEAEAERAAVREAEERLAASESRLEDLRKGQRPPELEQIRSRLAQARAALELSTVELRRREGLAREGVIARDELDRAKTAFDQDRGRVAELEATLTTARLGGREDAIRAAEEDVRSLRAALDRSRWSLDEKTRRSPYAGLIFDTFFEPGEFVPAGSPVVAVLPPAMVKVRFFVPETVVGELTPGQEVRLACDGCEGGLAGRISYISPRVEYTPPVIYSVETRAKLVVMIEARVAPEVAVLLRPGQPVDVRRTRRGG